MPHDRFNEVYFNMFPALESETTCSNVVISYTSGVTEGQYQYKCCNVPQNGSSIHSKEKY